jgi:hypothetical protein
MTFKKKGHVYYVEWSFNASSSDNEDKYDDKKGTKKLLQA